MRWFENYDFIYKQKGLEIEISDNYYSKPCTKEEFNSYYEYTNDFTKKYEDINIPKFLKLPKEYIELLKYSNGGTIVNGDREFGFFDFKTIREFYIYYGFIIYAPNLLPIAFNGGGTFYAYKFTKEDIEPKIYGVHASCVGFEEETCFLGNNLNEVLSKKCDIDDEIHDYKVKNGTIKIPKLTQEELEKIELLNLLEKIKKDKELGEITLKEFLINKKKIKEKLSKLKTNNIKDKNE